MSISPGLISLMRRRDVHRGPMRRSSDALVLLSRHLTACVSASPRINLIDPYLNGLDAWQ
jgi:hypothetical protein